MIARVIDSDQSSEIGEERTISRTGGLKFWRAIPDDRLKVERDGFEGQEDFIRMLAGRHDYKRKLYVHLYYKTLFEKNVSFFKRLLRLA